MHSWLQPFSCNVSASSRKPDLRVSSLQLWESIIHHFRLWPINTEQLETAFSIDQINKSSVFYYKVMDQFSHFFTNNGLTVDVKWQKVCFLGEEEERSMEQTHIMEMAHPDRNVLNSTKTLGQDLQNNDWLFSLLILFQTIFSASFYTYIIILALSVSWK